MKKIGLILLAALIFLLPSLAAAERCGMLDFDNGIMWEYRNGAFFDMDGLKISPAVPNRKKIQIRVASGLVSIEKLSGIRAAGNQTALKFSVKSAMGKNLSLSRKGSGFLALFEGGADNLNLLLLDSDDGNVYRASVNSAVQKGKLVFALDGSAIFSVYDCSSE